MAYDLPQRMRRLRRNDSIRQLVRENQLHVSDLILPIFVEEEITEAVEVESMPGVFRYPEYQLQAVVERAWSKGIRAVILFGVSRHKDEEGLDTCDDKGLMARIIHAAKNAVPDMVVISDNCFCEYTKHGHCGVVKDDDVDNDATLENLARQAVVAAEAGADMIAPSGMMDGTVQVLRAALDARGYTHIPIMSYSTKFASAFYGPFRDAVDSNFKGDRKTYQLDPANGREALMESMLDDAEAADILMVKPGIAYLDVLVNIRANTLKPLAVYQVSGEYAMIKASARAGVIDEQAIMMESLLAFKRAGADLIITYFAEQAADLLNA